MHPQPGARHSPKSKFPFGLKYIHLLQAASRCARVAFGAIGLPAAFQILRSFFARPNFVFSEAVSGGGSGDSANALVRASSYIFLRSAAESFAKCGACTTTEMILECVILCSYHHSGAVGVSVIALVVGNIARGDEVSRAIAGLRDRDCCIKAI